MDSQENILTQYTNTYSPQIVYSTQLQTLHGKTPASLDNQLAGLLIDILEKALQTSAITQRIRVVSCKIAH